MKIQMTHKRLFYIKAYPRIHGAGYFMNTVEIIVSEGMTVRDLKDATGSSQINRQDVSISPGNLEEGMNLNDDLVFQPKGLYELVNLDINKSNNFVASQRTKAVEEGYSTRAFIPKTPYLMPPRGKEKYSALLGELIQKLHQ